MDREALRAIMTQLHGRRSRRQVLATVAKSSFVGVGAALIGRDLGAGLLTSRSASAARAGGAAVSIVDFAFDPPTLAVPVGTQVTWTNNGEAPHTATSDDGTTFDSDRLDPGGGVFSHTFETVGAYPYHCEIHPDMLGTVNVTEGEPEPETYVRRNLHSLDPSGPELTAYANAVEAMKALPNTDPLSWAYQANIHGTWSNPPPPEPPPASELPGWSTCEHGTLYFWPWHRMYLYWFEQVIREMSGDPAFALPYWDYSVPAQRVLPAPFIDPASPLFVAERDAGVNSGTPPGPELDSTFDHCSGLAQNIFDSASFSLEFGPHAGVHVWVAGLGGWMGAFETAARDPVFWMHHSNIDRLWESWLALGNVNSSDPTWLANDVHSVSGLPYTFFDKAGASVTTVRVVDEVLTAAALGYSYEGLSDLSGCPEFLLVPPGGEEAVDGTPVATPEGPIDLGSSAPEGGIEVGPEATKVPVTLDEPEAAAGIANAGGLTVLTLEGVQGTGVPAVAVEVYINLSPGQEPDNRSPYYVGNLNLFGLLFPDAEHRDMAMPSMTQQFNIARNVAALEATGEWTGEFEVTLVPYYTASTEVPEAPGATPEAVVPPAGPWVTVESVSVRAG